MPTTLHNKINNYINHIVIVLDESYSMERVRKQVVAVADAQIKYLAQRSKELDQETRITVFSFNYGFKCLIADMDVLRVPSIEKYYHPDGGTALIDASMRSIQELEKTWQTYGDHAFLVYVLTDGDENSSHTYRSHHLSHKISGLGENWTVATLVPDQAGVSFAQRYGFPPNNIAIWDATTTQGVAEAGTLLRDATDRYMQNRAKGIRGSRSVFSTSVEAVNDQTIAAAGLKPLPTNSYVLIPVPRDNPIREFVQTCGHTYKVGSAYYQLSKRESIQPQKSIAVVERNGGKVYTGKEARQMIGLPDMETRVSPDFNPLYDIFVQSTSVNRKLIAGTRLLLLT